MKEHKRGEKQFLWMKRVTHWRKMLMQLSQLFQPVKCCVKSLLFPKILFSSCLLTIRLVGTTAEIKLTPTKPSQSRLKFLSQKLIKIHLLSLSVARIWRLGRFIYARCVRRVSIKLIYLFLLFPRIKSDLRASASFVCCFGHTVPHFADFRSRFLLNCTFFISKCCKFQTLRQWRLQPRQLNDGIHWISRSAVSWRKTQPKLNTIDSDTSDRAASCGNDVQSVLCSNAENQSTFTRYSEIRHFSLSLGNYWSSTKTMENKIEKTF